MRHSFVYRANDGRGYGFVIDGKWLDIEVDDGSGYRLNHAQRILNGIIQWHVNDNAVPRDAKDFVERILKMPAFL